MTLGCAMPSGESDPFTAIVLPNETASREHPEGGTYAEAAMVGQLSDRESEVLRLLGEGCMNKEIAQRLGISPETVKSHLKHVFRKLRVERRAHAVLQAYIMGLIGRPRP